MQTQRETPHQNNIPKKQAPKVLQLGKFYPPHLGGIETVMRDICEGINQKGILCDCLVSNKHIAYKEEITSYGAKIFRTSSFGIIASTSISPQMIFKLRKIIKNYDIIHLHHPDPMAALALFFAPIKDKTIITHYHSDIFKNKWLLKCFMPLQNFILKHSNLIITTSENYIAQSPYLSIFKDKTVSIPIGIETNNTINNPSRNKNIICSVGRLVPLKGYEFLIESARYLPNDFEIHIAGEGSKTYTSKLLNLIKQLHLENRVFLVGKKTDKELENFYACAKYFVLPSTQESYGIVLVEAMSFGLPCICTNLKPSGMSFINQHNLTGKVIEPKNPNAIAKAILEISSQYDFYSKNAKNRYLQHFTKEKMIESFYKIYTKGYLL